MHRSAPKSVQTFFFYLSAYVPPTPVKNRMTMQISTANTLLTHIQNRKTQLSSFLVNCPVTKVTKTSMNRKKLKRGCNYAVSCIVLNKQHRWKCHSERGYYDAESCILLNKQHQRKCQLERFLPRQKNAPIISLQCMLMLLKTSCSWQCPHC